MKVWIVKYALTTGIKVADGKISDHARDMVVVKDSKAIGGISYYHGKNRDWCDNESDAIKCAEAMKQRKIESLRKQIAKLEKLRFEGGQ